MGKHQRVLLVSAVVLLAAPFAARQVIRASRAPEPQPRVLAAATVAVPDERLFVLPLPEATNLTGEGEPTDRAPEVYQGSFLAASVSEMLEQLGVRVFPEDRAYAFPDPRLGMGSTIRLYRAQPVLIRDAGDERVVRTWATTVGELAAEQRLALGEKDVVVPERSAGIPVSAAPLLLQITRVAEVEISITQPIPHTTTYIDDPEMERGTQKIEQAGKDGVLRKNFLVHRENGREVWRREVNRQVETEPRQAIIRRGTKVIEYEIGVASRYPKGFRIGSMTAAHKTLPFGTKVRVVNVSNGKSVVVRIADRGPYLPGRVIDLSYDAFAEIANPDSGVVNVRLEKEL
jgi:hypothetical protein